MNSITKGPFREARAWVVGLYCLLPGVLALWFDHPLILLAFLGAVLASSLGAGCLQQVLRTLSLALPFVLLIGLINVLAVREGVTVIFRGGALPVMGRLDVTLEACIYGGVLGLRALVVIGSCVLFSAVVRADELLQGVRRFSMKSAVTLTLATRMIPVLIRDAKRMHAAQRCRAPGRKWRAELVRSVLLGSLERAGETAATLEVRGYSLPSRRTTRTRLPWSRHDFALLASAVATLCTAVALSVIGIAAFTPYPKIELQLSLGLVAFAGVVISLNFLPLVDRRGVGQ